MDWVYKQIIGFLANFFAETGNMGAEMFEMSWVQSIVLFFSYLAWILYAVGFVVACAECGLEYSSGRADIKGTAMNLIKGFMAVSLFSVVPVKLYELCVSLQANFGYAQLIRRLTPGECELLQGFPPGWTDIPSASDSARYRALGNSVPVPCVEFIMKSLQAVAAMEADAMQSQVQGEYHAEERI